jgi:uncharacterized lipoprotein YajG
MKAKLKSLIIGVAASLLLAGCCSTHSTRWEYKVAAAPRYQAGMTPAQHYEAQQAFLDDLGNDGWALVSADQSVYYLKRPKR